MEFRSTWGLLGEIAIKFAEVSGVSASLHCMLDLAKSRPEIAKEGFFAVLVLPVDRGKNRYETRPRGQRRQPAAATSGNLPLYAGAHELRNSVS